MQNLKQRVLNIKSDDLMFSFIVLTFFLLPTGTAPPLISIGMAFLVWLISGKVFTIKSVIQQSWFFPVIPFLILPWIGLLYSQNLDLGVDYALKTKYWLAVFVTAGLSLDEKRVCLLLKWFWAGLFIGAFLALIQFAGLMAPINRLYLGFGTAHTLVVMYLLIGILMASFFFKRAESWKSRAILLLLIFAFIFHVAVLRGRAGYLFFIIISPVVANNLMYKFSLKIKVMVSLILVCSLLLSPVVRKVATYTFNNLKMEKETILKGKDAIEFPRFFIFSESIKVIIAHPLIGIGPGSIRETTKSKGMQVATHGHNNFLYMGTSFGVFGIAACFWLFWKMFTLSWQSRDTALGYFIFSTGMVLFLGGMLDTQILNTGTLLFLSLTYGMLNHLKT
ncbi:MAG: O-antigen ligase family protein [Desulfobacula sp.]|jgi:O-antigen ligase|nr:O-antigen ligase family protein [Desulfobacula sp.]MBT7261818.1 O-antigen ligase family protein [Desulfobacula sp.]